MISNSPCAFTTSQVQPEPKQVTADCVNAFLNSSNEPNFLSIASANFPDGKFGLAYDDKLKRYGFIDKDLNVKIEFMYLEALPFDSDGFAKVKLADIISIMNNTYRLIDTSGQLYTLIIGARQIIGSYNAVDLRKKFLPEIPSSIFEQEFLQILLLGYNSIEEIPESITKLKTLKILSLKHNQLKTLPNKIGHLTSLKKIDLSENPISKEEQEKIKKLLPNCEIIF